MFNQQDHRLVGTARFDNGYIWHCFCGSHARQQWPTPEIAAKKWQQGHIKELKAHKRWIENGARFN